LYVQAYELHKTKFGFYKGPSDIKRRTIIYGYRIGEVGLPEIPKVKADVKITARGTAQIRRSPVGVSMGCHVAGACNVKPDPNDTETILGGVCKRFVSLPPEADPALLGELRHFVRVWLRKNLKPLSSDVDTTVETWLENTNYPQSRRAELLKTWDNFRGEFLTPEGRPTRHSHVKSFIKDEFYPEFKHARAINSRKDEFKCRVGPIFKLIEQQVFKMPWFIKYVPVIERANFLKENLHQEGSKIGASDFSAFETHFIKIIMETIEFELYEYMSQDLPDSEWYKLVHDVLSGTNFCTFKDIMVEVEATRMSGEMCTSLGNGFANLMLMLFTLTRKGCTSIKGVVEGDDGLFTFYGPVPEPEDFAKLGFTIKLDIYDNLMDASFCGLLADQEDLEVITNVQVALMNFGFTTRQYVKCSDRKMLQLLRAKSMSMIYQYPACPILKELALYGLRVSEGMKFRIEDNLNEYWRTFMREAIDYIAKYGIPCREVKRRTRDLVAKRFGIPVEIQLSVEEYLRNLTTLQPLELPMLMPYIKQECRAYFDKYAFEVELTSPDLFFPPIEMVDYKVCPP